MVNNKTTSDQNLNAGGSFNVKRGYHAQDFKVNANSIVKLQLQQQTIVS